MWLKKDTLSAALTIGSILGSMALGRAVFAKTAALEAMEIPEQETRYVFTGSEIVRRDELPVVDELQEVATTIVPKSKNTAPLLSVPADTATADDIALLEAQLADAKRALAEMQTAAAVPAKPAPVLTEVTPPKTVQVVQVKPSRSTRAS